MQSLVVLSPKCVLLWSKENSNIQSSIIWKNFSKFVVHLFLHTIRPAAVFHPRWNQEYTSKLHGPQTLIGASWLSMLYSPAWPCHYIEVAYQIDRCFRSSSRVSSKMSPVRGQSVFSNNNTHIYEYAPCWWELWMVVVVLDKTQRLTACYNMLEPVCLWN